MRKMKHPTVARIIAAMNSSVTTSAVEEPGISGCSGVLLHCPPCSPGLQVPSGDSVSRGSL
jgi:hypothetical protein